MQSIEMTDSREKHFIHFYQVKIIAKHKQFSSLPSYARACSLANIVRLAVFVVLFKQTNKKKNKYRKLETKRQHMGRESENCRDPTNKLPNQIDWFEHRLCLSGIRIRINLCIMCVCVVAMETEWHGHSLNACREWDLSIGRECKLVFVFGRSCRCHGRCSCIIVKVEPCICQSNRLENFNDDLYHDTRKSGSILSHSYTVILQAQVANWFRIICRMKKWHPKRIAHFME